MPMKDLDPSPRSALTVSYSSSKFLGSASPNGSDSINFMNASVSFLEILFFVSTFSSIISSSIFFSSFLCNTVRISGKINCLSASSSNSSSSSSSTTMAFGVKSNLAFNSSCVDAVSCISSTVELSSFLETSSVVSVEEDGGFFRLLRFFFPAAIYTAVLLTREEGTKTRSPLLLLLLLLFVWMTNAVDDETSMLLFPTFVVKAAIIKEHSMVTTKQVIAVTTANIEHLIIFTQYNASLIVSVL
mmetsp:Transcript_28343/g.27201  ORF Transcript_28343/g.27201 Transcript_28343/m.27201 type:complete len:244 (+) Transcript_28343:663-1394(+)